MVNEGKLNWKAIALSFGTFWGVYLFLAALLGSLNVKTLWFSPEAFNMLTSIYPGLKATVGGAFIGLIWGFLCGSVCGAIISGLNNLFVKKV